jgi:glycerol-3-phosphate cytidylyltransferase
MIVYTTGVFDLLHRGHFNILTNARNLGDRLIVGIQDDNSVFHSKGRRPILTSKERSDQLLSLPFVDEVIVYSGTDQIPWYTKLQPDIVVQGDDWINTADRTEMIAFLKEHEIRLVLFPYTFDISSTEIKRRVLQSDERKDRSFILNNIKLFPIQDLRIYEKFNEEKTQKLTKKINEEGFFVNPITVAMTGKHLIVIDGVNRLEAVRRLGAKFVVAHTVLYSEVDLLRNVHYHKNGVTIRLSEFGEEGEGERVTFPAYTHNDIIKFVNEGITIPNGETWHRVKSAVIRLRIPFQSLVDGIDLEEFLNNKIESNQIRYYPNNVYVCDEWERGC